MKIQPHDHAPPRGTLACAEAIHRDQRHKGKPAPYTLPLISVSALGLEDGGTEDQAITALLNHAIEDTGQNHGSSAERLRGAEANIVRGSRSNTSDNTPAGEKEPWLLRWTRYIASHEDKHEASPVLAGKLSAGPEWLPLRGWRWPNSRRG